MTAKNVVIHLSSILRLPSWLDVLLRHFLLGLVGFSCHKALTPCEGKLLNALMT